MMSEENRKERLGIEFAAVSKMILMLGAMMKKAGASPELAVATIESVAPVLEDLVRAPGEKLVVVGLDRGGPVIAHGDDFEELKSFVDVLAAREAAVFGLNPAQVIAATELELGAGHVRH